MNYAEKFDQICSEARNEDVKNEIPDSLKSIAIYCYYHYFDGDDTSLDDLPNCILKNADDYSIAAIAESPASAEGIFEFIAKISRTQRYIVNLDTIKRIFQNLSRDLGELIYNKSPDPRLKSIYQQLIQKHSKKMDPDNYSFVIKLLCEWDVVPEQKMELINVASILSSAMKKPITFEILFDDDIQQEIDDVENPKEYVTLGSLKLFGDSNMCKIGDEGSFISLISAKSLKLAYFKSSTRGLFASNLRFYITNKRIDGQIGQTIIDEPENFAYYNNGIIITCRDFEIENGFLVLHDFSIVNGGQTTNIIGRTPIETDFPIVCKVIKEKYFAKEKSVEFLSKVAEASNTQKPINIADLIANKKEQRLLKLAFADAGMFLKIKRGEKINKSLYPEPWQNATNTVIAQMIYSSVFQCPGSAKNSKTTILSKETSYDQIFKTEYDNAFYVSLQHLKVQYSNWKSKTTNARSGEAKTSRRYGLAKNCDLFTYALIGFYIKLFTNERFSYGMNKLTTSDFSTDSERFKQLLRQNDIGKISMIKKSIINIIEKDSLFGLFQYLTDNILLPAYECFKEDFPTYAYGNFVKSDRYYYSYVLKKAYIVFKEKRENLYSVLDEYLVLNEDTSMDFDDSYNSSQYKPGLKEELSDYRVSKSKELKIKPYDIFKLDQLARFITERPSSVRELVYLCEMSEEKAKRFGKDILDIISKYTDLHDFDIVKE